MYCMYLHVASRISIAAGVLEILQINGYILYIIILCCCITAYVICCVRLYCIGTCFVFAGAAYRLNSAKKDSIELQLCLATLLTSLDSRSVSSVFTFVDKEEKEKSDKPWIETVQQILNCAIFRSCSAKQLARWEKKQLLADGWALRTNSGVRRMSLKKALCRQESATENTRWRCRIM